MKWLLAGTPDGRHAVYEVVRVEVATFRQRGMAEMFLATPEETDELVEEPWPEPEAAPETAAEPAPPEAENCAGPEPEAEPETAPAPQPLAPGNWSRAEAEAAPETAPEAAVDVDPMDDDALLPEAFDRLRNGDKLMVVADEMGMDWLKLRSAWARAQKQAKADAAPPVALEAAKEARLQAGWKQCPRCKIAFKNPDKKRTHCAGCTAALK